MIHAYTLILYHVLLQYNTYTTFSKARATVYLLLKKEQLVNQILLSILKTYKCLPVHAYKSLQGLNSDINYCPSFPTVKS